MVARAVARPLITMAFDSFSGRQSHFCHVLQLCHSWSEDGVHIAEPFTESCPFIHERASLHSPTPQHCVSVPVGVAATRQMIHGVKRCSLFFVSWCGRLTGFPPHMRIASGLVTLLLNTCTFTGTPQPTQKSLDGSFVPEQILPFLIYEYEFSID